MLPGSDSSQQTLLLDAYINFRFNQIKKKNGATDLNVIKNSQVIFLDPTRHINASGSVDQFPEILDKLNALNNGSYKPHSPQKFFSFTNNHGSHWNLSCRTIDTNGNVVEDKIACTGDGACGIHAIVEAVLKSDELKKIPLIRRNLNLLGIPLPATSTDHRSAIDFVLAIFEHHKQSGNTAGTTQTRIDTLKRLKNNPLNTSNWALSDDFAIFAEASNILLLNSGLIIGVNEDTPNQELRNTIIQNIVQRDEEKTEFLSFFRQQNSNPVFNGKDSDNAFADLFSEAHQEYTVFNATFSATLTNSKIKKEKDLIAQINEKQKGLDIINLIESLENVDERLFILHGALEEISKNKSPATSDDPTSLAIKVSLIIFHQNQIYNDLFDDNGIIKNQKKKSLKEHVDGEGMDWWVFPGHTLSKDLDKFTATPKIYQQLAADKEYCRRYKTFIYQYINSFDKEEEIVHAPRFFKLVESLIGMTDNGYRLLSGFTQKEQDILFIAVDNFYKEKSVNLIIDNNYTEHFNSLDKIAGESKEIDNRHSWIPLAREKLRARLELSEGQISSGVIQKKKNDPIFENNKKLDPAQKDDFQARSNPYSQNNKIGCGTLTDTIEGIKASYPFCHFRITHDPIAMRDNTSPIAKVKPIDKAEYLKHPPITAICIDYPDYRRDETLPLPEDLRKTYKQKTLETLTLYNNLEVDHLVKHGDGMGVFLKNIQIKGDSDKTRGLDIVEKAFQDYLDGFFDAITEFYQKNPNATLKKITFVTPDKALEEIFNEKLVAFKKDDSKSATLGVVEIKQDKAGPRFNSSKYYEQGTKKLGMTIAPNGDKRFLGGALDEGTVLEEQIALLSDMASIGNHKFNPNVTKKLSIFKDQRSDYCTLFHQDKYDSPVIEFNTEKDSKFDYKKRLDKDKEFKSEEFTKDKEQAEILKLLRKAKDDTLAELNIREIDDNFFVAVMKVASKNSGIARINTDIFNKDLKEALENLGSSTDSLDFKVEPNFHKIAKLFSANFQESSRQQNYLTAREGENDKINETGRRLFRVCTEENIQKFQLEINNSKQSPAPPATSPSSILKTSNNPNTKKKVVTFRSSIEEKRLEHEVKDNAR